QRHSEQYTSRTTQADWLDTVVKRLLWLLPEQSKPLVVSDRVAGTAKGTAGGTAGAVKRNVWTTRVEKPTLDQSEKAFLRAVLRRELPVLLAASSTRLLR
ncbi:hypothetical protein JX266_014504, partial [Neoarthrinium moseri]